MSNDFLSPTLTFAEAAPSGGKNLQTLGGLEGELAFAARDIFLSSCRLGFTPLGDGDREIHRHRTLRGKPCRRPRCEKHCQPDLIEKIRPA